MNAASPQRHREGAAALLLNADAFAVELVGEAWERGVWPPRDGGVTESRVYVDDDDVVGREHDPARLRLALMLAAAGLDERGDDLPENA